MSYFIVDPQDEIDRARETLQEWLERYADQKDWNGYYPAGWKITSPNTTGYLNIVSKKYDLYISNSEITIVFAIPGVDKSEISLTHEKGHLNVKCSRSTSKYEREATSVEINLPYAFEASCPVDETEYDVPNLKAKADNGMLVVRIPKFLNKKKFEFVIS